MLDFLMFRRLLKYNMLTSNISCRSLKWCLHFLVKHKNPRNQDPEECFEKSGRLEENSAKIPNFKIHFVLTNQSCLTSTLSLTKLEKNKVTKTDYFV